MLGYWNKSVYITYLGAFFAIGGLLLSLTEANIDYAFVGMILACVCDMFDGKVARSLKNRTENEKQFGVEIDSLCDVICFITVPGITLYFMGVNTWYGIILISLYVVCGIIRLGYFNVAMSDKDKAIKTYLGLPVPISVLIFGIVWLLSKICTFNVSLVYTILLPIVGYLHISKIKIKKFTSNWFYIIVCLFAVIGIILGLFIL